MYLRALAASAPGACAALQAARGAHVSWLLVGRMDDTLPPGPAFDGKHPPLPSELPPPSLSRAGLRAAGLRAAAPPPAALGGETRVSVP